MHPLLPLCDESILCKIWEADGCGKRQRDPPLGVQSDAVPLRRVPFLETTPLVEWSAESVCLGFGSPLDVFCPDLGQMRLYAVEQHRHLHLEGTGPYASLVVYVSFCRDVVHAHQN